MPPHETWLFLICISYFYHPTKKRVLYMNLLWLSKRYDIKQRALSIQYLALWLTEDNTYILPILQYIVVCEEELRTELSQHNIDKALIMAYKLTRVLDYSRTVLLALHFLKCPFCIVPSIITPINVKYVKKFRKYILWFLCNESLLMCASQIGKDVELQKKVNRRCQPWWGSLQKLHCWSWSK